MGTAMDVRRMTLGEGGGGVVVDRYDGSVKGLSRHVVSKQGHVRRKDARSIPAGSPQERCAWDRPL
jgi:hypothetical protein